MNTTPAADHVPQNHAPSPPSPEAAPEAAFAVEPARLARLFRHTVREGSVNPLLHLLPSLRKAGPP